MLLWLIRHPEPEASAVGRCYGSLDVGLSEKGIVQARAVAEALADQQLAAIYSSPKRRCTVAAEMIAVAHGRAFECVDALREIDFGEFEGRSYDEIAASHPELYREWMESPTSVCFPGGESFAEMRARVLDACATLLTRHADQLIAMVTHGGVIRVLLAEALGMPAEAVFRIGVEYGGVSLVRYFGGAAVVEFVNRAAQTNVKQYGR